MIPENVGGLTIQIDWTMAALWRKNTKNAIFTADICNISKNLQPL